MQEPRPRLVLLHVSPWSERARWALGHHGVAYDKIQHAPFLGERKLRRIVGPGKKRATVPVLITGDRVLTESWDIALYADQVGKGTKLIPEDRKAEVRKWNDLADETMNAARPLVIIALLASPEAMDESLPPQVPAVVRPLLRPVNRFGTKWFARKYGLRLDDTATPTAKLRSTFETIREALSKGSDYLLGSFSYADIVMAGTLQGVSPVADRYLRLGAATRRVWTNEGLAGEFADLVAWRDRLYDKHRRG